MKLYTEEFANVEEMQDFFVTYKIREADVLSITLVMAPAKPEWTQKYILHHWRQASGTGKRKIEVQ